ncbi:MAG: hypothetical protein LBC53_10075 [Spirochaetaceae bacterium]|jgi:hypothetical protein|nr:hypothetical protein [Spirochaetaceae bacterium]
MAGFFESMKSALSEGWEASKDLASKAGSRAQEIGEKGLVTVEIKKLEFNMERLVKKLGLEAYQLFVENGQESISAKHPNISAILEEISGVRLQIEQKQTELH